jgi:hypothetical protein
MKESKYPRLGYPEVYAMQQIVIAFKKDPNYLENSPYSELVKETLLALFTNPIVAAGTSVGDVGELNLEKETQYLYEKTKELLNASKDMKENITLVKNAQDLLAKSLDLYERAKNYRYVKDLEKAVVEVTKILPEEHKEKVLKTLQSSGN